MKGVLSLSAVKKKRHIFRSIFLVLLTIILVGLTTAAICCGIMGFKEEYEQYYRRAVANGADGNKIKNIIKGLDPTI